MNHEIHPLTPEKENPWRERAMQFIREGRIQGYLAYSDGNIIGWCNANDKKNFSALKQNINIDLEIDNESEKIKSVVCFLVAPDMRGKKIATKMLERICADAQANGYDLVEGYPPAGEWNMYAAHHGTTALFEKCGFEIHKQNGSGCIMRKKLKNV